MSPGVKLAITLRHLATSASYTTLQYAFRVASPTIEKFVPEVCDTITRAYRDQVMRCPTLSEDWLLVESVFRRRLNYPHALGAVDGRHIPIRCPQGGSSLFHNCKGFHSIVSLPWWMEITSSCGWTWGQPSQLQMLKFSSTPI